MAKPACGARKPIKNQEGQGMLDIDENSSVEDDMFENVKTDEDMDHEMEEEEGGSAFEEEIDPEQAANARAKRFMRITKPEVMVNIAIWIAVAVASAIILSFCYEFFTK